MRHWFVHLCRRDSLDSRTTSQLALFLRRNAGKNSILQEKTILSVAKWINTDNPKMRREILSDAENALHLHANLFGATHDLKHIARRYGKPGQCGLIPWFHELSTGYGFYPDPVTRRLVLPADQNGYDRKYMLDLPRLQWCTPLGEAYALTHDERYARMAMRILDDFITYVPPRAGVPWFNAMDTGIRAANMLLLWNFLRNSAAFDDAFVIRFWQSIIEHVRACLEAPEDYPIEPPHPMAELPHVRAVRAKGRVFRLYANHYLSGRTGVWAAINSLPGNPVLSKLRETVAADMEREVLHEILPEGMDFEDSTHYHRLVTEMLFSWAMVCRHAGRPISSKARERFRRVFEFVRDITKPDGLIPQIGDMDNGRMHIFGYGDWRDMRYLTQLGACYFDDRKLLAPGTILSRYALWHFGTRAVKYTDEDKSIHLTSKVQRKTGMAVLRTGRAYAVFSALRNGQDGAGGHSHGDKLGVEYSLGARNILVDPGLGCYMSDFELRKLFRSAKSHSVLIADGGEINPICPGYPWYVPDEARARFTTADLKSNTITGESRAFYDSSSKIIHHRTVHLSRNGTLAIHDRVTGLGRHSMEWRFVLAPNLSVRFDRKKNTAVIRDDEGVCTILKYQSGIGLKPALDSVSYAWEYGRWSPTRVIILTARILLPFAAIFSFEPSR